MKPETEVLLNRIAVAVLIALTVIGFYGFLKYTP